MGPGHHKIGQWTESIANKGELIFSKGGGIQNKQRTSNNSNEECNTLRLKCPENEVTSEKA